MISYLLNYFTQVWACLTGSCQGTELMIEYIEYKRGTSFEYAGELVTKATSVPFDLTGWSIEAQIRHEAYKEAKTVIQVLDTVVLNGPLGLFKITVNDVLDTETWPLGRAVFDICFISAGGKRMNIIGMIRINVIDPATQVE